MLVDLARRGFSHPHAVAFVKRAVIVNGESSEKVEIPVWGGVLLYVSVVIAAVGVSLVGLLSFLSNLILHAHKTR